jgi:hypothetical protein
MFVVLFFFLIGCIYRSESDLMIRNGIIEEQSSFVVGGRLISNFLRETLVDHIFADKMVEYGHYK